MGDWKSVLRDYAHEHNLEWHDTDMGVGLGFSDGYDVFWVLPGEVFSTVHCDMNGPEPDRDLVTEYQAINIIRGQVIHALRHHLAEKKCCVRYCRNGAWDVKSHNGCSQSSVDVGAVLTGLSHQQQNAFQVMTKFCNRLCLGKAPSAKRFGRYLNTPLPPKRERLLDSTSVQQQVEETEDDEHQSIADVARSMATCAAMDHIEKYMDRLKTLGSDPPMGRIGQMLLLLDKLLPNVSASCDLATPGILSIHFTDGLASHDIHLQSREIALLIGEHDLAGTAKVLAEQYQKNNAMRTTFFNVLWQAADGRGWAKDVTSGLSILTSTSHLVLGGPFREVTLDTGSNLTVMLSSLPMDQVIRQLLIQVPDFVQDCLSCLASGVSSEKLTASPPVRKLKCKLSDMPTSSLLMDLTADHIAAMDVFANAQLKDFFKEKQAIYKYKSRTYYDPKIDTWCKPDEWITLALSQVDEQWPPAIAILILHDAGHTAVQDAVARFMKPEVFEHDVVDEDIRIAWLYRQAYPEIARSLFVDDCSNVPDWEIRAELGDSVAIRYALTGWENQMDWGEKDILPKPGLISLYPQEYQNNLHRFLLETVQDMTSCSPPNEESLKLAAAVGWSDVVEAMMVNPYLLPGLLTSERRLDGMDEPGILWAGKMLLYWSRLLPNEFLARLLVTARHTDLLEMAKQAGIKSAEGRPEIAKNLQSTFGIYEHMINHLNFDMAIAWTRCRKYLDV